MKKICNKASKKGIVAVLLTFMMMLTTIIPVWAQQPQQTTDISQWAIGALNEGERYGIYPVEWYYDSFRSEISQERLEILLTHTDNKIASLGLNKKQDFVPVSYKADSTRGDVVIRMYNILAQYDLPIGELPVDYMKERGILQGTSKGLELDQICTTEQAVILATRLVEDTYNLLDAGSKGFAWEVEHNGNIIYFLGSIHIGNNELYPINQRLKQAFNESDALIVEANLFDQEGGMEYFLEKSTYQDDTTLKDNISQDIYEKVLKVFEKLDLPEEVYTQIKPWRVANDLSVISMTSSEEPQMASQSAGLGMDIYFLTKALVTQKPIQELEGIKYQADLFDGLSHEFQEEYLDAILDSILDPQTNEAPDSAQMLDEWLKQWKNGDVEGFTSDYNGITEEFENELTNMLFGKRDKDMAEKIIDILESEEKGTYFVVVGAGHFVRDNTVIHHLREKGYNVEVFQ